MREMLKQVQHDVSVLGLLISHFRLPSSVSQLPTSNSHLPTYYHISTLKLPVAIHISIVYDNKYGYNGKTLAECIIDLLYNHAEIV